MARKPRKRAKRGRPSGYSRARGEAICRQIADGKTLRELKVATSTVMRWVADHPEFREQYARAREAQADSLAEEIIHEARKATPANAQAVRVQIDALKWAASKRAPKKYGDRASVEHSGPEGGPIQSSVDLKGVALDVLKKLVVDDDTPEDPQE